MVGDEACEDGCDLKRSSLPSPPMLQEAVLQGKTRNVILISAQLDSPYRQPRRVTHDQVNPPTGENLRLDGVAEYKAPNRVSALTYQTSK